MHLTEQEIQKIREFFRTQPVRKAYLFGSYARGEADEKSDVDLLVEIDYDRLVSALDVFLWHEYLAEILGKKVDVVTGAKPGSRFRNNIASDLHPIYEQAA
ncbi:nucleotidyltransferase family protein [Hymenobacter latericus]|uniref:nucleotidyltransferase family protein n=1 Tax=Hymenobacter sp. YIM 151858-1 TaxID=2987688 RepID=UPI002227AEC0|nr:nucleotidyltransferase domain-containing protein [Hymenobacter sp. YIM 151858-1]UYZ57681.1 nucleotidyltransferase domain-containing protein [Hymenobacter sp. YIM 151858-1]